MFPHDTPEDRKSILSRHRSAVLKRQNYLAGEIAQSQIEDLDRYFESVGVENRYIFCSPKGTFVTFDQYIQRAVTDRKELTKAFLMNRWDHINERTFRTKSTQEQLKHKEVVIDMIESIITVIPVYIENLKSLVSRSNLYTYAGLAKVLGDDEAIFNLLKDGTDIQVRDLLVSGRKKILERP
jgi:hypothetical protein